MPVKIQQIKREIKYSSTADCCDDTLLCVTKILLNFIPMLYYLG